MNLKSDYYHIYGINLYPKNPLLVDFKAKSWLAYFSAGGTLVKETKGQTGELEHESLKLFDNYVSAMALSADGGLLAVGSVGTNNYKERIAFVAILDPREFTVIESLSQYRDEILQLEFSRDSRYLAVLTKDERLAIHSTRDLGNVRYFDKIKIKDFAWVESPDSAPLLVSIQYTKIDKFEVNEDAFGRIQVKHDVAMIAEGPKRNYDVIKPSLNGQLIYGATSGGELNIFDIHKAKFLNSYTVSTHGITYIEDFGDHIVIADGSSSLQRIYLMGKLFDAEKINLTETIRYITRNPLNPGEAYATTKEGSLLIYNDIDFQVQVKAKYPVNRVTAVDINANKRLIALACENGDCEFWDLEYLTYVNRYHFNKAPSCTKIYLSDQLDICIAGYSDGSIRAFSVQGLNLNSEISCEYTIHKAHKSPICFIQLEGNQLLTAATDSMIRIWNFKTKALVDELQYHCKDISLLVFDKANKDIIFTGAKDRQLISYSLSRGHKLGCSIIPNGYVTAIAQIDDSTIVTAGNNCDIGIWDKRGMNLLDKITVPRSVIQVQYLAQDQLLWVDSEGYLSVYDMQAKQLVFERRMSYMGVCHIFSRSPRNVLVFNSTGEIIDLDLTN